MRQLNIEVIGSRTITLPVGKLGESSYLCRRIQKALFLIPKIEDSS